MSHNADNIFTFSAFPRQTMRNIRFLTNSDV